MIAPATWNPPGFAVFSQQNTKIKKKCRFTMFFNSYANMYNIHSIFIFNYDIIIPGKLSMVPDSYVSMSERLLKDWKRA